MWLGIFISLAFYPQMRNYPNFFFVLWLLLSLHPLAKPLTTNFVKTVHVCYHLCPRNRHSPGPMCVCGMVSKFDLCPQSWDHQRELLLHPCLAPQAIHRGQNAMCWEPCHPRAPFTLGINAPQNCVVVGHQKYRIHVCYCLRENKKLGGVTAEILP